MRYRSIPGSTLTLLNYLDRPFRPHVRLEPLPTSASETSWASTTSHTRRPTSIQTLAPTRNLAFDGTLATTLPLLQQGETALHTVGVIFLASGHFSFRVAVEEINLETASETPPKIRFSPLLRVDVVA